MFCRIKEALNIYQRSINSQQEVGALITTDELVFLFFSVYKSNLFIMITSVESNGRPFHRSYIKYHSEVVLQTHKQSASICFCSFFSFSSTIPQLLISLHGCAPPPHLTLSTSSHTHAHAVTHTCAHTPQHPIYFADE